MGGCICVCVCNQNIFFITLGVCCGIIGLSCCCCERRYQHIINYRRSRNIYPILIPPQSQILQQTDNIVLITNPYQNEVFIGTLINKI